MVYAYVTNLLKTSKNYRTEYQGLFKTLRPKT
jgi:hypothetical protein